MKATENITNETQKVTSKKLSFFEKAKAMKNKKRKYAGVEVDPGLAKKHSELMVYLGITTFSDLHRYAITKLHRELITAKKEVA